MEEKSKIELLLKQRIECNGGNSDDVICWNHADSSFPTLVIRVYNRQVKKKPPPVSQERRQV